MKAPHPTAIVNLDVIREEVEAAVGRRFESFRGLSLAWRVFAGEPFELLLAEASHAATEGGAK